MGLFDLFKGKKKRKVYAGGVVIEYETTPPNFRDKDALPPQDGNLSAPSLHPPGGGGSAGPGTRKAPG